MVERVPDEAALQRLRSGLRIEDYQTRPCQAKILAPQPEVRRARPPVRVRKTVQDVWLEITLIEGKNRQVRKMTAAIGHPTLRLVRQSLANLSLAGLLPGPMAGNCPGRHCMAARHRQQAHLQPPQKPQTTSINSRNPWFSAHNARLLFFFFSRLGTL